MVLTVLESPAGYGSKDGNLFHLLSNEESGGFVWQAGDGI